MSKESVDEIMEQVHTANSCISRNDYDKQTAILRKMIEKSLAENQDECAILRAKCEIYERYMKAATHELYSGISLAKAT